MKLSSGKCTGGSRRAQRRDKGRSGRVAIDVQVSRCWLEISVESRERKLAQVESDPILPSYSMRRTSRKKWKKKKKLCNRGSRLRTYHSIFSSGRETLANRIGFVRTAIKLAPSNKFRIVGCAEEGWYSTLLAPRSTLVPSYPRFVISQRLRVELLNYSCSSRTNGNLFLDYEYPTPEETSPYAILTGTNFPHPFLNLPFPNFQSL